MDMVTVFCVTVVTRCICGIVRQAEQRDVCTSAVRRELVRYQRISSESGRGRAV